MHEYAIVQSLLDRVEEAARSHGATAVRRLSVRLGELAGVEPALLATAYTLCRERSICAHAELDIQRIAARWECPRCASAIARGTILRCPVCAAPARLAAGDEIILERIEMEVP